MHLANLMNRTFWFVQPVFISIYFLLSNSLSYVHEGDWLGYGGPWKSHVLEKWVRTGRLGVVMSRWPVCAVSTSPSWFPMPRVVLVPIFMLVCCLLTLAVTKSLWSGSIYTKQPLTQWNTLIWEGILQGFQAQSTRMETIQQRFIKSLLIRW